MATRRIPRTRHEDRYVERLELRDVSRGESKFAKLGKMFAVYVLSPYYDLNFSTRKVELVLKGATFVGGERFKTAFTSEDRVSEECNVFSSMDLALRKAETFLDLDNVVVIECPKHLQKIMTCDWDNSKWLEVSMSKNQSFKEILQEDTSIQDRISELIKENTLLFYFLKYHSDKTEKYIQKLALLDDNVNSSSYYRSLLMVNHYLDRLLNDGEKLPFPNLENHSGSKSIKEYLNYLER